MATALAEGASDDTSMPVARARVVLPSAGENKPSNVSIFCELATGPAVEAPAGTDAGPAPAASAPEAASPPTATWLQILRHEHPLIDAPLESKGHDDTKTVVFVSSAAGHDDTKTAVFVSSPAGHDDTKPAVFVSSSAGLDDTKPGVFVSASAGHDDTKLAVSCHIPPGMMIQKSGFHIILGRA